MSFCNQCGAQLQDGARFCPACGSPVRSAAQQPYTDPEYKAPSYPTPQYTAPVRPDAEFDPEDVRQNKVMAILAYFGILVLVPVFAAKESKYARFHANQGFVLFICEAAYGVVYSILNSIITAIHIPFLSFVLSLVYVAFFVFSILGIIHAAKGESKKLPVIGDFTILK